MRTFPGRQSGFTFLWLLFLVAGLGVGMAALGTMWHTAVQREKEAELLFIGDQYRRAIESFRQATPIGQTPRWPKTLDELLLDPRSVQTVRHLRRLYHDPIPDSIPNPITGTVEWGLLRDDDGGISGVYSQSEKAPRRMDNFPKPYQDFAGKLSYKEWIFSAAASALASPAQGGASGLQVAGEGGQGGQGGQQQPDGSVAPRPESTGIATEAERARAACLNEKDRANLACNVLVGQVQAVCHGQAYARFLVCLQGT